MKRDERGAGGEKPRAQEAAEGKAAGETTIERLEPKGDNPCFGCGGGNPRGMRLVFERDAARWRIIGRFRIGPDYQGSAGILHGGIIALLLDEAMGKLNWFHNVRAATAELSVEYLRPVPVGEEITVEAEEVTRDGRNLIHRGEIRAAGGDLLARGRGRFVVVEPRDPRA